LQNIIKAPVAAFFSKGAGTHKYPAVLKLEMVVQRKLKEAGDTGIFFMNINQGYLK
jgi:hypothetical protein